MAISFRKIGKRFFILANLLACFVFLIACLQPWLNPETFWLVAFMSLSFPVALALVVLFFFFWLFVKIRYTLISLTVLLIGWKQISVLFSLQESSFKQEKKNGSIRVMDWNLRSFSGLKEGRNARADNTDRMFELIKKQEADVVCFQEFGMKENAVGDEDYVGRMKKLGFNFFVLSKDYSRLTYHYTNGLAIFSRKPFVSTGRIPFTSSPESILYADIVFNEADTIRVFTTHLQSFKFSGRDYEDIEKIKNTDNNIVSASKNIFSKMKRAFRNRGSQADQIRPLLDSCPYPEVICCDMNDVPASYAYWQLKGNRKDAFLERGFGIGRTFIALAPTLRIDYILADERLSVEQFKINAQRYSDHLSLVADLKLVKP